MSDPVFGFGSNVGFEFGPHTETNARSEPGTGPGHEVGPMKATVRFGFLVQAVATVRFSRFGSRSRFQTIRFSLR